MGSCEVSGCSGDEWGVCRGERGAVRVNGTKLEPGQPGGGGGVVNTHPFARGPRGTELPRSTRWTLWRLEPAG